MKTGTPGQETPKKSWVAENVWWNNPRANQRRSGWESHWQSNREGILLTSQIGTQRVLFHSADSYRVRCISQSKWEMTIVEQLFGSRTSFTKHTVGRVGKKSVETCCTGWWPHFKEFLQIWIRPEYWDVLRFHWFEAGTSEIEVLRFTRALFGLLQSPFLLGATLKLHLESLRNQYPKEVAKIEKCLYVDDIITEWDTTDEVLKLKTTTIIIFQEAKFDLHKWQSNESAFRRGKQNLWWQTKFCKGAARSQTRRNQIVGTAVEQSRGYIIWLPHCRRLTHLREKSHHLASIYNPLRFGFMLVGKLLYHEVCKQYLPWDAKVSKTWKIRGKKLRRTYRSEWKYNEVSHQSKNQLRQLICRYSEIRVAKGRPLLLIH